MRVRAMAMFFGAGLVLAAAGAAIAFDPRTAAEVAAGLEAHSVCSAVFVQGLDGEATHREMVRMLTGPAGALLQHRVDQAGHGVDATFAGLAHARADFTPGSGCRLRNAANTPLPPAPPAVPPPADDFAPDHQVTTNDPALATAIDRVFAERPGAPIKQVKAIVIVKDGHVVAERYASGFGVQTPLISY